jgi:hypothetical protein
MTARSALAGKSIATMPAAEVMTIASWLAALSQSPQPVTLTEK